MNIQQLLKQSLPFVVENTYGIQFIVYPADMSNMHTLVEGTFTGSMGYVGGIEKCTLVDYFEAEEAYEPGQRSTCTCSIETLLQVGCACGAIKRYEEKLNEAA